MEQHDRAVDYAFNNGLSTNPTLRLSDQPGPIIHFENTEDAIRTSDLFALAGNNLFDFALSPQDTRPQLLRHYVVA